MKSYENRYFSGFPDRCTVSLAGQITATLNHLPDGADEVRIRNDSATSLIAFVITVNQAPSSAATSRAPLVLYSDPLIEPSQKPLLAGEEQAVLTRHFVGRGPNSRGIRSFAEPIVCAGIYKDGSPTGDSTLLARLFIRRSNMLLAVETALETLAEAGRHNVPRDQLIEQFRKMADPLGRWYVPPEQQVARGLYQSLIGKLLNLPRIPAGTPFPPSGFVSQETEMLNRQRVALIESQPSLLDATLISAR